MAKRTKKNSTKKPATKKRNRKVESESESAVATATEEEDEEEVELDDGIDDADLEDDEDADDEDYESEDDEEDEDDSEEDEEEESDEEDEEEESDEEGESEEDEEASWSEGYEVIDYAPDEITPTIERDPDSPKVKELAKSIRQNGLINPIVISSDAKILAGNRRYAAMVKLGMKKIPCRVACNKRGEQVSSEDYEAAIQSLADNVNRATMTPLEQGREFANLIKNKTVEDAAEISRMFGIPVKAVQKYIGLATDSTDALVEALESDKITTEAALTIQRRSKTPEEIDELLGNLIAAGNGKKITDQAAKKGAAKSGKKKQSKRGRKPSNRPLSDEVLMTEETSISGALKIDRESGVYTVNLNVAIDWDKKTFGTFNLERSIQQQLSKLDRKKINAELEVARKALTGEDEE